MNREIFDQIMTNVIADKVLGFEALN